jgi:hypothetical protein
MTKVIKLGMVMILCYNAICSCYSSSLVRDEETEAAVKTTWSLFGNVTREIWTKRKEAAREGLGSFCRTFNPRFWAPIFAEKIEQSRRPPQQDEILFASLIDKYVSNSLVNENFASMTLQKMAWNWFKDMVEKMIPVMNQLDDLEHSLIVQHLREYIVSNVFVKVFACGWEGNCKSPPSSQLSTFIEHVRTYLFRDYILMIDGYMRDYLAPALEQIDQLPDRETSPLIEQVVQIVQRKWKSPLESIINNHTFVIADIHNMHLDMTSCIANYMKEADGASDCTIWALAANICEGAEALVNAIHRGRSSSATVLLSLISHLSVVEKL